MNLITYLYRQSWPLLFLTTVCGIANGLCGAGIVALIGKAVSGNGPRLLLGGAFLGLCVLQLLCKSSADIAMLRMTQNAIADLRVDLSRRLLATPFKKLQELGKPELLVIFTNDIEHFTMAFRMMPSIIGNLFVILCCLGYIAWLSWKLLAAIVIFLVVAIVAYQLAQSVFMRQLIEVRGKTGELHRHFQGLIDGSKELKLNARRGDRFVNQVIAHSALEFKKIFVRAMSGFVWVENSGAMAFNVLLGLILFVFPQWFPEDAATLTGSTLILLYLIRPISEVVAMLPGLSLGSIALGKIRQLQERIAGASDVPAGNPFPGDAPLRLELRGVSHRYRSDSEERQFMLGPIDFAVDQGECVFIVGGNGSGKTTLAMLISGLYEPEEGHVALNGRPVAADDAAAYRQHFSAVFADFHLFEQLLAADDPDVARRAVDYIEQFGMAHKVRVVDGKFSTIDLSTGQRKRLALVASYLEDRPIYLFDEWASDQDPAFKRIFYTKLLPELKARGKAVLVISHDDAYFKYADRIVKLNEGRLQPLTEPETCH